MVRVYRSFASGEHALSDVPDTIFSARTLLALPPHPYFFIREEKTQQSRAI